MSSAEADEVRATVDTNDNNDNNDSVPVQASWKMHSSNRTDRTKTLVKDIAWYKCTRTQFGTKRENTGERLLCVATSSRKPAESQRRGCFFFFVVLTLVILLKRYYCRSNTQYDVNERLTSWDKGEHVFYRCHEIGGCVIKLWYGTG